MTRKGALAPTAAEAVDKARPPAQQLRWTARATHRAMEGWQRVASEQDWLRIIEESREAYESGGFLLERLGAHTSADFLVFLKRLTRGYRGQELHVILDNSSTHTTPAVQAWLARHPRVHFHFTPKGASWLNLVEAWFSILTRKSVRRGSFDTVLALIRHIERYLAEWNAHPTPFIWTKDPADIIKKALRRRAGR